MADRVPDKRVPERRDVRRDERIGLLIVMCLAALAGAVDASGLFLLKDLYVSFMSGNTTSMAAALAKADLPRVRLIAGILLTFVAGAAAGTALAVLTGRRHVPVVILAAAAVLVVPVGAADWSIPAMTFATGMLNATIHEAGSVQVSITYVTGTLVKVGRGLGMMLCRQSQDWTWLRQAVPWVGLLAGAAPTTYAMIHIGHATLVALPLTALLIGTGSWFALAQAAVEAPASPPPRL